MILRLLNTQNTNWRYIRKGVKSLTLPTFTDGEFSRTRGENLSTCGEWRVADNRESTVFIAILPSHSLTKQDYFLSLCSNLKYLRAVFLSVDNKDIEILIEQQTA